MSVTINNDNKGMLYKYLQLLFLNFKEEITLTLNSLLSIEETFILLDAIVDICKINGFIIELGPQFLEDSVLSNDKLEFKEKLYFTTLGEKILWVLKNNKEYLNFKKIVLIQDTLGVDPIIMKKKGIDMDVYFMFHHVVVDNMREVVNKNNYHFVNLERKR